jgi:hypothetical protein
VMLEAPHYRPKVTRLLTLNLPIHVYKTDTI